jgi:MFS family permease
VLVRSDLRWRMLVILSLARLAMGFQFQSIAALSAFFEQDLQLDSSSVGFLIGIYMLPGVFVALPVGILGAKVGDKRSLAFGLLLMLLGGVLSVCTTSYPVALTARAISGVGAVIVNIMLAKMTMDWFIGKEIILAMAINMNAWPVGICLALFTLSPLASATSWRVAVSLCTLLVLISLVAVQFFYQSPSSPDSSTNRAKLSFKSIMPRPIFPVLLSALPWALFHTAYLLLVGFLPIYLQSTGLAVTEATSLAGTLSLLIILSILGGGAIIAKAGRAKMVSVISLFLFTWAIGLMLLIFAPGPWVWLVLIGLVAGAPTGALAALPSEVLEPQTRASGMGLVYTVAYLSTGTFPALAGFLMKSMQQPAAPLVLVVVLVFGTIVTLKSFSIYKKQL